MSIFPLISSIAVIVAAIFCLLWLITLAFMLRGLWKKHRPMCWISGILLLVLTLAGIPIAGGIIGTVGTAVIIDGYLRFRDEYKKIFNEMPTDDITEFRFETNSSFGEARNSVHTYLKFNASKATFDRIRPPSLKPASLEHWVSITGGNPEWMQPPGASEVWMLPPKDGKKETAKETTLMAYDAQTGTVFYYHLGID